MKAEYEEASLEHCRVRGKIMSAVLIIKNPPGEGEDDPAVDLFSQGLSLMFHISSPSERE